MNSLIYSTLFCVVFIQTALFSQNDFIANPHVIRIDTRTYYEGLKDTYLIQTTKDFGLKGNVKSIKEVEMDTTETVKETHQFRFLENNKLVYYQKGDTLQELQNSFGKYAIFTFDNQQDKLLKIEYIHRAFGSTNTYYTILNTDGYVEKFTSQRRKTNNPHSNAAVWTCYYQWNNNYTKVKVRYISEVTDKKDENNEQTSYQFKFDKNGLLVSEKEIEKSEYALNKSISYDSILKLPTSYSVIGGNIFVWDLISYNEKGLVTQKVRNNHTIQNSLIYDNCSKQYKYNEYGDLIETISQCMDGSFGMDGYFSDGISKATIQYSGYDEHNNWTIKRNGRSIYKREILYYD